MRQSHAGDGPIPAALRSSREQAGAGDGGDPLKYCIFTTLALLAWLAGPVVVTAMAALGLVAYGRALRRGRRRSRCLLRDTRLVLAYLAGAMVVGMAGVLGRIG